MKPNPLLSKITLSLLFVALCGTAVARELRVPANSEYLISEAEAELRIDRLVLGDNAVIRFAPSVRRWLVDAKKADIGSGVLIDGRGLAGASGQAGASQTGQAKDCSDGKSGADGSKGQRGQSAVNIYIRAGIASLGDLRIQADGGNGGAGGRGGSGQMGGDINYCRGGAGGDGGNGGPGAPGGNGGKVDLVLWPVSSSLDMLAIRRAVKVSNKGGRGGEGGVGGAAGGGVEGRYRKGGGPGGKKWLAGGDSGAVGQDGAHGKNGDVGQVNLTEDLKQQIGNLDRKIEYRQQAQASRPVSAAATARQLDAEEYDRRLQALERRIEALEAKLRSK